MRTKALEYTVFVFTAGGFGVFLRWMQRQLAFDERGLCGPSAFNVLLPLFIAALVWLLRKRNRELLNRHVSMSLLQDEALQNPGKIYAAARWFCGGLMALGGVLVIRGSETEKLELMLRVLGILAILAGLSVSLYLSIVNRPVGRKKRGALCLLSMAPILLFALWMVYDYRANAINSVMWDYLIEVLCVSTLLLAYFRLAGFAFGQPEPKKLLFWLQFGCFIALTALADSRSTGMQMILLAAALQLALTDYILVANLQEKELVELMAEAAKEPNDGFDRLN